MLENLCPQAEARVCAPRFWGLGNIVSRAETLQWPQVSHEFQKKMKYTRKGYSVELVLAKARDWAVGSCCDSGPAPSYWPLSTSEPKLSRQISRKLTTLPGYKTAKVEPLAIRDLGAYRPADFMFSFKQQRWFLLFSPRNLNRSMIDKKKVHRHSIFP